jgi:hypothetical protein
MSIVQIDFLEVYDVCNAIFGALTFTTIRVMSVYVGLLCVYALLCLLTVCIRGSYGRYPPETPEGYNTIVYRCMVYCLECFFLNLLCRIYVVCSIFGCFKRLYQLICVVGGMIGWL